MATSDLSYLIMTKRVVLALLLTITAPVKAGEVASFNESYTDTVKVSGQLIKGLQFSQTKLTLTPYALLPGDFTGSICAEVSSIDGRYRSAFTIDYPDPVTGMTELPFPTQYTEQLESFEASELALLLWTAPQCDDPNKQYVLGSWGPADTSQPLQVLIRSSARRDVMVAGAKSGQRLTSKCTPIASGYTVSFDKLCEIGGVDVIKQENLILQRRNLRALPDVNIPLLVGTKTP